MITNTIKKFIRVESLSGILLFGATLLALIWANSPFSWLYHHIWNYELGVVITNFELIKPLILWVNDGLMALFFFLIGLEIKRELVIGELNSLRKATLPLFAAIGGMSVPALVFFLANGNPETMDGWAVPMATDIAFSLAIIKLLGKRVPLALKVFLTAFAIVDDLGAVIIIAVFYSSGIKWILILSALALVVLLYGIFARFSYSKYVLLAVGVVVWVLFLKAGVHPTIAGVLLAFTVPIQRRVNFPEFFGKMAAVMKRIKPIGPNPTPLLTREQIDEIDSMENLLEEAQSPLQHLERGLHNWVAYLIMPVFALSNAGVTISPDLPLDYQLVFVIALALIVGNPIGITSLSYLAVRLKLTTLPESLNMKHIIGASMLAGVGFTMSIFIANLAFAGEAGLLQSAKVGILLGSLVSGLAGYLLLRSMGGGTEYETEDG